MSFNINANFGNFVMEIQRQIQILLRALNKDTTLGAMQAMCLPATKHSTSNLKKHLDVSCP